MPINDAAVEIARRAIEQFDSYRATIAQTRLDETWMQAQAFEPVDWSREGLT